MKIKQTLMRFIEFLQINRRTGHTSLLNEIGKKNDVYIIIHDMRMREEFDPEIRDKLISITNISILQGAPNKPVLLDNKALLDLLNDSVEKINDLAAVAQQRKEILQSINELLSENEDI